MLDLTSLKDNNPNKKNTEEIIDNEIHLLNENLKSVINKIIENIK